MDDDYTEDVGPLPGTSNSVDMDEDYADNRRKPPRRGSYYTYSSKTSDEDASLPSWSPSPSNPQSGIDERENSRNTLVFTAKKRKSTISFTVMIFTILGVFMYYSSRTTMRLALYEADNLVAFTAQVNDQLKRAERDVRRLERQLVALDAIDQKNEDLEEEKKVMEQAAMFANPTMVEEMSEIQQKLKTSATQAKQLKQHVIETSKHEVVEKYGATPQRVELELVFPGNLAGPSKFVMEMAPVEMMPHSVHTFLEMVSFGLLDGCSFIINAMHVLKVAPLPYDDTISDELGQQFAEHGLQSVAFREYSHEYPHKQYTVRFAADGSPSFYINTEDNTEIHVGDPCFAKVVSGFDTIKRLESSPTRNGIWFETRIGIQKATIL